MYLGKVVGTLVSTQKEASLDGLKFLVVRRLSVDNQDERSYVVAADAVGAGLGEVVMIATGSSARQTVMTDKRPCDAVVMAIVATLALMMLRAGNAIAWPWWAVFAPLIGVLALCVIIVVVAFFVAIIGLLIDQIRHP